MEPRASSLLPVVNDLLRSPQRTCDRCLADPDLQQLGLASLLCIAAGGALFGGVLGSMRGGLQVAFAALKLPLAMVAALAICVPAFHALAAGLGRPLPLRSIVALTLAGAGRAALVLLGFAPMLWLLVDLGLSYHQTVVTAVLCYALAGMAALGVLVRALQRDARGLLVALAFLAVLLPVGGQAAWTLRPFLGRPAQTAVPFLRVPESSFLDAVWTSSWSALGFYVPEPRHADWEE